MYADARFIALSFWLLVQLVGSEGSWMGTHCNTYVIVRNEKRLAGPVSTNEVPVYSPTNEIKRGEGREGRERVRGKETKSKEEEIKRVSESGGRRTKSLGRI